MGAVLSVLFYVAAVAVTALAGFFAYSMLLDPKRKHRAGEPPLDAGAIPFLGHALSFGKNPLGFIRECQKKHGPVFTVIIAGKRMTFITDPLSYPAFFRNSKTLSFKEITNEITSKVLRSDRPWTDQEYDDVHRYYTKYLQGEELVPLTNRLQEELESRFVAALGEKRGKFWQEGPLYEFVVRSIFFSSVPGFFGDGFGMEQTFQDYRTFDKYFALPLAGVPQIFLSAWVKASDGLFRAVATIKERARVSNFMKARENRFDEMNMNFHDRGANQSAMVWASQANSIPAAFWSLAYLLKDEEAKKVVMEEIKQVLGDYKPGQAPVSRDQFKQLVKLESAINEAMRLTSGGMSLRYALEDQTFHIESTNTDVNLRKGDRVIVFPYVTHYDPEVFAEPEKFKWDRFLAKPAASKKSPGGDDSGDGAAVADNEPLVQPTFSKGGKPVKMALLPFGGGTSHCPGRFFAMNEVKMFVLMSLLWFNMEVRDYVPIPPLDLTRAGLGTFPPAGDMWFRRRWRL
eukprot:TRINITY_DN271_c0_g1_i1.p1 TRINITY_DN271_c0_g1~~TRINITY_DN271_c0_g1_i1.p1  ORF type:complete len:515 (-),score=105.69 TRINITY_DN271_c0_g1_i1:82-1626(-)